MTYSNSSIRDETRTLRRHKEIAARDTRDRD